MAAHCLHEITRNGMGSHVCCWCGETRPDKFIEVVSVGHGEHEPNKRVILAPAVWADECPAAER